MKYTLQLPEGDPRKIRILDVEATADTVLLTVVVEERPVRVRRARRTENPEAHGTIVCEFKIASGETRYIFEPSMARGNMVVLTPDELVILD